MDGEKNLLVEHESLAHLRRLGFCAKFGLFRGLWRLVEAAPTVVFRRVQRQFLKRLLLFSFGAPFRGCVSIRLESVLGLANAIQINNAASLEIDDKLGALAQLALNVDAAPLRQNDLSTNTEAQADASLVLI